MCRSPGTLVVCLRDCQARYVGGNDESPQLIDDAWTYNANLRAEDGSRERDRRNAFRELVLVPLVFLGLILLLILLMSHSAFGQAGSGRIVGR